MKIPRLMPLKRERKERERILTSLMTQLSQIQTNYNQNWKRTNPILFLQTNRAILLFILSTSKKRISSAFQLEKNPRLLSNVSWLVWDNNSCRYNAFLSVFILCLHHKIPNFNPTKIDWHHLISENSSNLCQLSDTIMIVFQLLTEERKLLDRDISSQDRQK